MNSSIREQESWYNNSRYAITIHNNRRKWWIKIKVYGFRNNKHGIIEIENSLETEQVFVGGLIDVYSVTDDLDVVFNDEGLINGLKPRVVILGGNVDGEGGIRELKEIIHGDCFVCRHDAEGNFVSVREEDVDTIRHFVKTIISVYADVIIIEE